MIPQYDLNDPAQRAAAIAAEVEVLRVKHEAKEKFDAERSTKHVPVATLNVEQLYERPTTAYLIDRLIPRGGLVEIVGASETMKTFCSLDMALTIAASSKTSFHDLPVVMHGPVLYIAGEGQGSLPNRIRAWSQHTGINATELPFHAIVVPTNFLSAAVQDDVKRIVRDISPLMIFVDTLHRVIPGGEENSSKELGVVISFAAQLQAEFGSTVLFLHHPPKSNPAGQGRGSGALYNAADTEISAVIERNTERPDGTKIVTFTVVKQKDDDKVSFTLKNKIVKILKDGREMVHEGTTRPVTSCVLVKADAADVADAAADTLTPKILAHVGSNPGCVKKEIRKAVGGRTDAVFAAIDQLVASGQLMLTNRKEGRVIRGEYRVSPVEEAPF